MKKSYRRLLTTCLLISSFILFCGIDGCEKEILPPTGLSIIDTRMTSLDLSWAPLTVDNGTLSYYNVYLSTDGGSTYSVYATSSDTEVTLECLYPDTDYDIKVTAIDKQENESEDSEVVSATTLPNDGTIYEGDTSEDDIPSLSGITTILGNFNIDNNTLTDFSSLEDLTTICGDLLIFNNDVLTGLSGLDNLTSVVGDLQIYSNDVLTSLSGLNNLTSVGGFLHIFMNDVLTSLAGLENVTSVGGYLLIYANPLTTLFGLDNLTSVGGYLDIRYNGALTSLSGLNSLTSVGGDLVIQYNPTLTDLSALYNVVLSGELLGIVQNYLLPTANAWALNKQMRANGFRGSTIILSNGISIQ